MRGAITNKIGTSEFQKYLPILRPKKVDHLPALKEKEKKFDY
jgi:hypothetical protein